MTDFYYFGCIRESGHYVFPAPRSPRLHYHDIRIPKLDGGLCPTEDDKWGGGQVQGRALLHHINGWTVISFWDRTVDARPGSNSNFLAVGDFSFEQMLEMAREKFPEVMGRLPFDVVQVTP